MIKKGNTQMSRSRSCSMSYIKYVQKSGLSPNIFFYVCKNIMLISISDVKLQHVILILSLKVFESKIIKKWKLTFSLGPRKLMIMYNFILYACFI